MMNEYETLGGCHETHLCQRALPAVVSNLTFHLSAVSLGIPPRNTLSLSSLKRTCAYASRRFCSARRRAFWVPARGVLVFVVLLEGVLGKVNLFGGRNDSGSTSLLLSSSDSMALPEAPWVGMVVPLVFLLCREIGLRALLGSSLGKGLWIFGLRRYARIRSDTYNTMMHLSCPSGETPSTMGTSTSLPESCCSTCFPFDFLGNLGTSLCRGDVDSLSEEVNVRSIISWAEVVATWLRAGP